MVFFAIFLLNTIPKIFLLGDYIKIAMVRSYGRDYLESLWQLFAGFSKDLRHLSVRTSSLVECLYLYLYCP